MLNGVIIKRIFLLYFAAVVVSLGHGAQRSLEESVADVKSGHDRGNLGKESGLVGYWKLQGDCRDYSEQDNHGVNHEI